MNTKWEGQSQFFLFFESIRVFFCNYSWWWLLAGNACYKQQWGQHEASWGRGLAGNLQHLSQQCGLQTAGVRLSWEILGCRLATYSIHSPQCLARWGYSPPIILDLSSHLHTCKHRHLQINSVTVFNLPSDIFIAAHLLVFLFTPSRL